MDPATLHASELANTASVPADCDNNKNPSMSEIGELEGFRSTGRPCAAYRSSYYLENREPPRDNSAKEQSHPFQKLFFGCAEKNWPCGRPVQSLGLGLSSNRHPQRPLLGRFHQHPKTQARHDRRLIISYGCSHLQLRASYFN